MELIDLTLIWVGIVSFAIFMYVIMDGFDLGIGILFPFAPGDKARDDMMNSVAPIWDGNETWLILGGAGLLAAFPLLYSIMLPALYIGVFLMLAGLIFRGVAFEFRFKATRNKHLWDYSFNLGSTVAAFAQGAVVGAYIQGFTTEGTSYVGGAFDWLTPFTVMTGLGVVVGYALLGATWTIIKTEGEVQAWAYRVAPWLLGTLMLFFLIVSIWTPLAHERVMARWLDNLSVLWIFPVLTVVVSAVLMRALQQRKEVLPFLCTLLIFALFLLGMAISKWPYAIPPTFTFHEAASDPGSQLFLLLGFLFVIPIVLGYTAWTYWVFRGKVSGQQGYGH
ncbi:cytochrome d ubiquinol oxidase subunit II [Alcanivorax sp. JB21]|uniref:cytochrome d ubiquinol oxidase subunit II n=1 Tax=Alcanivorax limicola TaxID=2874102 RepID=UPI001CBB253A|nr:cytochrome d ubiquinol oxidase subunit II [Alcanivorax limicola]MBZ2188112.1 cytochrome d ubiquinol oxidase subunit II [Alcanivorax limicola]